MNLTVWLLSLPAATAASPLTLDTVLASVDRHAPKLAALDAKVTEAEAKALAARGAFDPTLKSKVRDYSGPYDRFQADTALSMQSGFGPSVTAGYRIGAGAFPTYAGAYETLDLGEVRVEVATPLLADLGMTAERAKRLVSDHHATAARSLRDDGRQQLYGKAATTYWKWVAAGEKLALSMELLALAEARQTGLEQQVAEGALPPLEAIDNQRVVWSRRADVATAEQVVTESAVALSLFLRDDRMEPLVPDVSALPTGTPGPSSRPTNDTDLIPRALAARPDLVAFDALLDAATVDLQRARSTLLPDVDGMVGWSQDRSTIPDDKGTQPEVVVGMDLKVPLALRKGRGELARSRAAFDRLAAERRWLVDQITAEVRALIQARALALTRWEHASAAVSHAREVAHLETRALELGASDIFKVTKREETLAKERKAEIDARAEVARIDALLQTATASWSAPGV